MESMRVASEFGCKEVYRFSHYILIPTFLVSVLFGGIIPTFCLLCERFLFLFILFLRN